MALYLVQMRAQQALRQRRSDLATFAIALVFMLAFGMHDLWLTTLADASDWRDAFYLTPIGAPLVFLVLGWHVTGRFEAALRVAERANADLEARVTAARGELEAIWAERNMLATREAASEERDRIYRDLHDDVGARLLSLVYGAQDDHVRTLAREALAELREMMSAPLEAADAFTTTLPLLREEIESRLLDADIALSWEQTDEVMDQDFSARVVYHLKRMLREVISNVIRHAQAQRVEVRIDTGSCGEVLVLEIEDDGLGLPPQWQPGRGVAGLRYRAREIGAQVSLTATGGGSLCRIEIPCPFGTRPAAPLVPATGAR